MNAGIHAIGTGLVPVETDQGKLRFGHAGIDGTDADAGAVEFESEGLGDRTFGGLDPAIGGAAFVGRVPGDGPDIEDPCARMVRDRGQERAGDAEETEEVGLDHPFPVRVAGGGDRIQTEGTAGVVDEDIHAGGDGTELRGEGIDGSRRGDVEDEVMGGCGASAAGIRGDSGETVRAAGGEDDMGALASEGDGGGGTEAARSPGDDDPTTCKLHAVMGPEAGGGGNEFGTQGGEVAAFQNPCIPKLWVGNRRWRVGGLAAGPSALLYPQRRDAPFQNPGSTGPCPLWQG